MTKKHLALIIIAFGVVAVAVPALAALTFSGTSISGDGAVTIDSPSTISIGTSTATGVTIGKSSSTSTFPGNVAVGSAVLEPNGSAAFGNAGGIGGGSLDSGVGAVVDIENTFTTDISSTPALQVLQDANLSTDSANTAYGGVFFSQTHQSSPKNYGRLVGLFAGGVSQGSGYVSQAIGIEAQAINQDVGTTGDLIGAHILSPDPNTVGGGTSTNVIGITVDDQTVGTNNWAIRTGKGKVEFGDALLLDPGTFSSIGTCNSGSEGTIRSVNNSTTSTLGATITGGGSNHVLAYCDGTNWTVMAK